MLDLMFKCCQIRILLQHSGQIQMRKEQVSSELIAATVRSHTNDEANVTSIMFASVLVMTCVPFAIER